MTASRSKESAVLHALLSAAYTNGREGGDEMRDAIKVHTTQLTVDEMQGVITGLCGWVAAAYERITEASTS